MLGSAVRMPLVRAAARQAALGGDHEIVGVGVQRLGDQSLGDFRSVRVCRVDQVDVELDGAPQHALALVRVSRGSPHTPSPVSRIAPKPRRLTVVSPPMSKVPDALAETSSCVSLMVVIALGRLDSDASRSRPWPGLWPPYQDQVMDFRRFRDRAEAGRLPAERLAQAAGRDDVVGSDCPWWYSGRLRDSQEADDPLEAFLVPKLGVPVTRNTRLGRSRPGACASPKKQVSSSRHPAGWIDASTRRSGASRAP